MWLIPSLSPRSDVLPDGVPAHYAALSEKGQPRFPRGEAASSPRERRFPCPRTDASPGLRVPSCTRCPASLRETHARFASSRCLPRATRREAPSSTRCDKRPFPPQKKISNLENVQTGFLSRCRRAARALGINKFIKTVAAQQTSHA